MHEFKPWADTTLSGRVPQIHCLEAKKNHVELSILRIVFAVLESGFGLSFLFVAGMTHLHCIVHASICTLQSCHPNISYKPLMVDRVTLISLYIRDLLMQEPTLSPDAAHSPLMYDLSYRLEAILYDHTLDGVLQD